MYLSADHLTDEVFISRFEDCSLPPEQFHHREHIRLARLYLRSYGPIEGLAKVCEGIKRFAASQGKASRYHETITWAYVFLVHERLALAAEDQAWEEFVETNTDLFDWEQSILNKYYRQDVLRSEIARRVFLLPERTR